MTAPIQSADALPTLACACASLRRAARAVTQLYSEALRGTGLQPTQFTTLQVLQRKGEMTQGELGRLLATDSTTLSRTLKPMQQDRLVAIRPGQDSRERLVSITPRGRDVAGQARSKWEAVQDRLKGRVGAAQWDRLLGELAAVAGVAAATRHS